MKKTILFALLFAGAMGSIKAQTITATGVVKSSEGDPLHFAFVQDKQGKQAVYTDSLGNFSLQVMPNSQLYVNCTGYRDTLIKINDQKNFDIVLHISGVYITATKAAVAESANRTSLKQDFSDDITLQSGFIKNNPQFNTGTGTIIPSFQPKEETQGSKYFYKGWLHGYVINSKDSIVQSPSFRFEYDKISGYLLLTKDQKSAIEIDKDLVKAFTLYDNMNKPYTFEKVPQIDNNHYVQVVASGNKYKIYKHIKTNFIKSNYTTDGLSSQGNNYDEYLDENTYYVYDVKTNALQKLSLKKKSLKEDFSSDADKLSKFMSDHSSEDIDDFYLTTLGNFMNQ